MGTRSLAPNHRNTWEHLQQSIYKIYREKKVQKFTFLAYASYMYNRDHLHNVNSGSSNLQLTIHVPLKIKNYKLCPSHAFNYILFVPLIDWMLFISYYVLCCLLEVFIWLPVINQKRVWLNTRCECSKTWSDISLKDPDGLFIKRCLEIHSKG